MKWKKLVGGASFSTRSLWLPKSAEILKTEIPGGPSQPYSREKLMMANLWKRLSKSQSRYQKANSETTPSWKHNGWKQNCSRCALDAPDHSVWYQKVLIWTIFTEDFCQRCHDVKGRRHVISSNTTWRMNKMPSKMVIQEGWQQTTLKSIESFERQRLYTRITSYQGG